MTWFASNPSHPRFSRAWRSRGERVRKIVLPDRLRRLAELVGALLGGTPQPATTMGEGLVTLAVDRHQIGPLLFAAVKEGRHPIAPDLLHRLEQSYGASAARRVSALARLNTIAARFSVLDVPWMALKGTTQAAQLYSDPAWRDSSDIDIVVPSAMFARALDALAGLGFVASYPPVPSNGLLRAAVLGAVRDVTLIARDDHACAIELHRRIFFANGRQIRFLHFPVTPGAIPTPSPGPDLAFYLIAHGALSYWVRLKWLVDLVPLFARLSPEDRLAVLDRARRAHCESSVAASLLLLRALFPFAALDPLLPWLERLRSQPAVQRRLARYVELLARDDDQKHSPLNNALTMLQANGMLFESSSMRAGILLSAPLSSAMRRIAGYLHPADRALTLPTRHRDPVKIR